MGKLDDIKKAKHPYQVPEGYFDNLTSEIVSRKNDLREQKPYLSYAGRWSLAGLATAAAIIVLVIFLPVTKTNSPGDYLADVSDEDIIEYLAMQDLSTDEIISNFGDDITFADEQQIIEDELEMDDDLIDQLYYEMELESEFDKL